MTEKFSAENLVEYLVRNISKETDLPDGWDKYLPQYASIELARPKSLLVVSQGQTQYIVNLISGEKLQSFLVRDLTLACAAQALAELTNSSPPLSSKFSSRDLSRSDSGTGKASSETGGNGRISTGIPTGGDHIYSPYGTRDPNAPPGFENEPRYSRTGPELQFNPDQDLNPPGGRYPLLTPMGTAIFGPRGGMHPSPADPNQPGGIRYDPTSPFDPSNGAGFPGSERSGPGIGRNGLGGSGFGGSGFGGSGFGGSGLGGPGSGGSGPSFPF